jgi:SAM-dependent methyltransferase
MTTAHRDLIIDQFTKQALPFSELRGPSHEESRRLLLEATGATGADTVLDVACGPGLVVLAFAAVARHVTGIDVTPAMIERARVLQAQRGLSNVSWQVGDVSRLPFGDGAFTVVTCRYAVHHFPDPGAAVREMVRVCAPGGRVALIDVFTTPEKAGAYNGMEKLRDPSHVRALTLEELGGLASAGGLTGLRTWFYRMEVELEALMRGSFPAPGDAQKVRESLTADVGHDRLGAGVHRRGEETYLAYPIAIVVGDKAG